ncbi:MAG: hypothetical protein LUH47_06705 [Clostridiales bacterium]|nr:hypothetical protein [Clostridiales bacterium]
MSKANIDNLIQVVEGNLTFPPVKIPLGLVAYIYQESDRNEYYSIANGIEYGYKLGYFRGHKDANTAMRKQKRRCKNGQTEFMEGHSRD